MEWIKTHTKEIKAAEETAKMTGSASLQSSNQLMEKLMKEEQSS